MAKLMSRNAAETINMFCRSLQEFVQRATADAVSPPTQRGTVTPERARSQVVLKQFLYYSELL